MTFSHSAASPLSPCGLGSGKKLGSCLPNATGAAALVDPPPPHPPTSSPHPFHVPSLECVLQESANTDVWTCHPAALKKKHSFFSLPRESSLTPCLMRVFVCGVLRGGGVVSDPGRPLRLSHRSVCHREKVLKAQNSL